MVYRILMLVEMLVMLKKMTNLCNLMEAIDFLSKTNSFQEWIFGQANWACLSHRSLEGGTRVQQIIIGYFVAPISQYLEPIFKIRTIKLFCFFSLQDVVFKWHSFYDKPGSYVLHLFKRDANKKVSNKLTYNLVHWKGFVKNELEFEKRILY